MDLPDFTGKIVLFYLRDVPDWAALGFAMESIMFRHQGDSVFLTGRVVSQANADFSDDWRAGLETGLDWNCVYHYLVMSSRDEYDARLARHKSAYDTRRRKWFFF